LKRSSQFSTTKLCADLAGNIFCTAVKSKPHCSARISASCRQHVDAGDDLHNQLRRSAAAQFAHAKNLRSRGCKDVTAAVKQLNFPADHTAQRPGARAGLAAADRRVENMRFIAANLLASI